MVMQRHQRVAPLETACQRDKVVVLRVVQHAQSHTMTAEERESFVCSSPGQGFITKGSLKKHIARQHSENPKKPLTEQESFLCPECGKGFTKET